MKLKTQDHYKIDVKFLVQEEEQTLSLKVNCMTPRKMIEYVDKANDPKSSFDDLIQCNCDVVNGWDGVFDEDDNEIEYSPEKLKDLQLDYFGLADAIGFQICNEAKTLREKCSGPLEDLSE